MSDKLNRDAVLRLTLCAMMVALSAALRTLTVPFYIGGALTMKVNFDGAFLAFAAAIGGPLYGAIAYGAADVIGYLLNPAGGAFLPLITIVAVLKGAAVGALWRVTRTADIHKIGPACAAGFGAIAAFGVFNALSAQLYAASRYATWISGFGPNAPYFSGGLIIAGCLGLACCAVAYVVRHRFGKAAENYFRAMAALMLPGLAGTAANTWALAFYGLLPDRAFSILLATRVSKEALLVVFNAYLLVAIIQAYRKAFAKAAV